MYKGSGEIKLPPNMLAILVKKPSHRFTFTIGQMGGQLEKNRLLHLWNEKIPLIKSWCIYIYTNSTKAELLLSFLFSWLSQSIKIRRFVAFIQYVFQIIGGRKIGSLNSGVIITHISLSLSVSIKYMAVHIYNAVYRYRITRLGRRGRRRRRWWRIEEWRDSSCAIYQLKILLLPFYVTKYSPIYMSRATAKQLFPFLSPFVIFTHGLWCV